MNPSTLVLVSSAAVVAEAAAQGASLAMANQSSLERGSSPGLADLQRAYLANAQAFLRDLTRSRSYTLHAVDADKDFVRAVLGDLSAFLDRQDAMHNDLLTGMVEEIAAQMEDAGLRILAQDTELQYLLPPDRRKERIPQISLPEPRNTTCEQPALSFPALWTDGAESATFEEACERFGRRLAAMGTEIDALGITSDRDLDTLHASARRLKDIEGEVDRLLSVRAGIDPASIDAFSHLFDRLEGLKATIEVAAYEVDDTATCIENSDAWQTTYREATAKIEGVNADLDRELDLLDADNLPGVLDTTLARATAEPLTVTLYASVHAEISAKISSTRQTARELSSKAKALRREIDGMSAAMRKGQLADALANFESLESRLQKAVSLVESETPSRLLCLDTLESDIPAGPLAAVPPAPLFSIRTLQIDESTPREIIEVLAHVPRDVYENANANIELALIATCLLYTSPSPRDS